MLVKAGVDQLSVETVNKVSDLYSSRVFVDDPARYLR